MNTDPSTRRRPKPSEQGYILVGVIFMLALLIIALMVAAPKIAKSIQRDRELETMRRGKQYARAVKLYYKQFNAYPPNLDALTKTNEIRFLRKKYIDPTTGKDEWKIIRVGQNKAPTAFGFFGVPLTGAGMGAGLCGNTGLNSTSSGTFGGSSSSSSSTFGGSSSSGFSSGSSGSSFGSSSSSGSSFGSSSSTAGCPSATSSTDSSASSGNSGTGSGSSTDQSSTNGSTDPNGANGGSTSNGSSNSGVGNGNASSTNGSGTGTNSGTGLSGQTFGGGIMGFSPNSPKQSILVYKKKNHYNEWEFVYDPLADQMMMQGGNTGAIGTPAGGMPGGSPIGNGSTFGPGSGNGGNSIFSPPGGTPPPGTSPPPPPPSTPPQ